MTSVSETGAQHSSHHTPVPKIGTLVAVWGALLGLTLLTTSVSYVDMGAINIVVALLIALCKAGLVAWIFMGVRYTTSLTKLFVVAGLVWLCILIALTFVDYGTRGWTYHARPWSSNSSASDIR